MGKQVAMILRLFCKNGNFIQIEYEQKLIVQRLQSHSFPCGYRDPIIECRKLVDKDILINSNFEMVDNQQIAPLGLKGSVKIQLNIDDINQLKGQDLLLKEGSKVVKRIAITGKGLTVQDVPNGVYTI
ncbi:hypothetical protein P7H20_25765 [Paenibacillus larvae]|nr:hypothetical protein [Paenibacillus larvae]MDT2277569.1 hypothetical protein [Paenibacillus larvae]